MKIHSFLTLLLTGVCLLQLPCPLRADPATPTGAVLEDEWLKKYRVLQALQDPAGLKFDGGYIYDRIKSSNRKFYYRAEYKGDVLGVKEATLKPSDKLQNGVDMPSLDTDSRSLFVKLERGQGAASGQIADALGITKLNASGLRKFRGVLQVLARTDPDRADLAAGLEYEPLHPLPRSLNIPHWVILGFQTGTQSTIGDKHDGISMFTLRSFAAKGFLPVVSDEHKLTYDARTNFLKEYPSYTSVHDAVLAGTEIPATVATTAGAKETITNRLNNLYVTAPTFREDSDLTAAQMSALVAYITGPHPTPDAPWKAKVLDVAALDLNDPSLVNKNSNEKLKSLILQGLYMDPNRAAVLNTIPQVPTNIVDLGKTAAPTPIGDIKVAHYLANRLLLDAVLPADYGKLDDAEIWQKKVEAEFFFSTRAKDFSTVSLWAETQGWLAVSGGNDLKKLNNLTALTLTRWLTNSWDRNKWVRLRYEYGRERAEPDVRRNFLAASLGYAF